MFKYNNLYHYYFFRIPIITRINNTIPATKHNDAIIQIIKNAVITFTYPPNQETNVQVLKRCNLFWYFGIRYCLEFRI